MFDVNPLGHSLHLKQIDREMTAIHRAAPPAGDDAPARKGRALAGILAVLRRLVAAQTRRAETTTAGIGTR